MANFISFIKKTSFLALIALQLCSCSDKTCLDLELIQTLEQEMFSWYVDDTASKSYFISDRYGMGQSLFAYKPEANQTNQQVEDDCGQTANAYFFSIQYNTSVSPLHFMVDILGAAPGYGGYSIELSWMRTLQNDMPGQKAVFDLQTQKSRNADANCKILENTTIGGKTYARILLVEFNRTAFPNAIKKIWYAPQDGILAFEDALENRFEQRPTN